MNIKTLKLEDDCFYNPSNGELITDPDMIHEEANSLIAYWLDEYPEEGFIKDKDLNESFQKYLSDKKSSGGGVFNFHDLEAFLISCDINPNWVAFKLPDSSPSGPTPYIVLNLNN